MKIFQNLRIALNGYDIDALIERFAVRCDAHWKRAPEQERRLNILEEKLFCFEHNPGDGLPGATLSLFEESPGSWYVANIVPAQYGRLTVEEYNGLLTSFYATIAAPSAAGLPVALTLSPGEVFLEDVLGAESLRLLQRFSVAANKSDCGGHPADRRRWLEFLVSVRRKVRADWSASLLQHWLIENGWPEECARQLESEYRFAEELFDAVAEA